MRAVNLVPADARRGPVGPRGAPRGPAYAVIGLLGVALAFVTVYVLTSNTISERRAQAAELKAETAREQAQVATYTKYTQFAKLAQARAATVRQIASTRFDWYDALSDLAKVVPANTSLQSLFGSVAPGAGTGTSSGTSAGTGGGAGGSGIASSLRNAISAPAFELVGCTATQDDVAQLMSRLRLINGVTRVTLGDSQKPDAAQPATAVGGSGSSVGCRANAPTFDLVVFFKPLPGAASAPGTGAATATPAAAASPAAGASTTSTTSTATPTPNATTTTGAATTTPVGSTTTTGGTK